MVSRFSGIAYVLIAAAFLALTACSHPPQIGTVTSKHFTPSYTWYQQVCVSYGKYGCQAYMPFPVTEPDAWTICLHRDAQDTSHDQTGCWDTDRADWQQYQVGDHYPDAR